LRVKVFVVFIFLAFATSGFAARIVPTGKVSIIKGGNVIGEFNQEAPLPEGFLLRCEAKCAIQLDDVDMQVEPKTAFSVSPMANRNDLTVQQGTVYYSLKESSRPLHFDTPTEKATTGNLYMTNVELKGYVRAVEGVTEIGVLDGGAMMLEIGSDKLSVFSGEKLTITSADSGKNAVVTIKQAEAGLNTNTKYMIETISSTGNYGAGGPDGGGPGGGGSDGGGSGGEGPGGGGSDGGGSDGGGSGGGGGSSGGPSGGKGGGGSSGGPSGGKGGDNR
jgi:hypothetical protein